jgi:uncharacterized protein (TIGR02598 family)
MKIFNTFGCSHGSTSRRRKAFSLLEVVIALGVIAVGIVGILAVFPTALQTGHSAQDETRAAHIAQSVFGSLVAGATSQFNAVSLPPTPLPIDLTTGSGTTPAVTVYADNNGNLVANAANAAYAIFIYTNNSVPGFTDVTSANEVTLRVAWPANAPTANQTFRDYVRVISRY